MISTENVDAVSPSEGPQPTPSASVPRPRRRGFAEWFYRRQALADARMELSQTPPLEARRLLYARRALELADRAFDPVDPLRTGSSVALALSLYREAAYWALLARDQAATAANLEQAFANADAPLLLLVAQGEDGLRNVRAALVQKDFVATAEDTEQQHQQDAALARDFVHRLVGLGLDPQVRVGRIVLQRWARTLGGCLLVIGLLVGGWVAAGLLRQGPDLAAGKPWRASSEYPGCNLRQHLCGATVMKIFFHTNEEDQPWVQFDLGQRTRFSHVDLVNRSDADSDRAAPVVLESSNDAKKWKELARRDATYTTWHAAFAPVSARFVRARLLKRTWFHLEGFHVYAR